MLQVSIGLPEQLCTQLAGVAKQLDVQLPDVLLAGLAVLLKRYSREDDITIGSLVAAGEEQVRPVLSWCPA